MFRTAIAFVMLVFFATGCAVKESLPVVSQAAPAVKTLKLADIPIHDPWILAYQQTQTYYLYTSADPRDLGEGHFGVKVYKSKDLQNWQGPYIVYRIPDGIWANPAHGAWAPEVHFYNGRYYLFVTLHNRDKIIDNPPASWRTTHMRGTVVLVGDSPEGPFEQMQDRPHPPADFMTLDGTLYVEDGVPWMLYCHEWIQTIDGTMAVQLKPDLSAAVGEPIHLFKASDAPWLNAHAKVSKEPRSYVTDGPFLFKTKTGRLLDALDRLKLSEDTCVIMFSDNGGPSAKENGADNGPLKGTKCTLYEGGIRVPMAMRFPRKFACGVVCEDIVSSLDIAPTCLDAAGVGFASGDFDGVSLCGAMRAGESKPIRRGPLFWYFDGQFAAIDGEWKLVRTSLFQNYQQKQKLSEVCLYNLKDDIGETTDLSDKYPEIVQKMTGLYRKWQAQMNITQ